MAYYYKRIEQLNAEIKTSRDLVDEAKEQEFIKKANTLKEKEKKLAVLKTKLGKLQSETAGQQDNTISKISYLNKSNNQLNEISEAQLEDQLLDDLDQVRKRIRELEKTRDSNQRSDLVNHREIVTLGEKTRKIEHEGLGIKEHPEERSSSPKKGGLWGM